MCTQPSHIFSGLTAQPAETHFSAQPLRTQTPCVAPPRSSRRARIWELPHHALCPVIGVCLPLTLLRKLVGKAVGGEVQAIDYELHCGVINECKQRSAVSQRVQDALDERYRLALQRHRTLKDTPALADTWRAGLHSPDIAAIFWSVVTHPACDAPLLEQVLQDVHMLQHQVGMMQRVESERFQDLLRENAVLGRELAGAQSRSARQAAEFARQVERLEASQLRLRGELLQRETLLAQALDEVTQLKSSVPDLEPRLALTEDKRWLTERLESAQRALQAAQWRIQQLEARSVHPPEAPVAASQIGLPDHTESLPNLKLKETQGRPKVSCPSVGGRDGQGPALGGILKAVLCVGGRSASVPVYRRLVEHTGGKFLHHDGGEEHNLHQLDAALVAADLVLCQTGCISHDAYWKVKDYCKRTGKRCVFVETPSQSALQRALRAATTPDSPADIP